MSSKLHRSVILGFTVVLAGVTTGNAQNRVPRLIITRHSINAPMCTALDDLESADSIVLGIGNSAPNGTHLEFAPLEYQSLFAVRAILATNFDTTADDPFVVDLADELLIGITSSGFGEYEAMHARRGGLSDLRLHIGGNGSPTGAVARTGSNGGVLVLGSFPAVYINGTTHPGENHLWGKIILTDDLYYANHRICIAIGLFSR